MRMIVGEPMANIIPQINVTGPAGDELSFQSDAVLPEQFFQERRGSQELRPFSRLMYAILIDAVRCYQVNFDARHGSKKQEFSEAMGWLFHDEGIGPFSFERVCDSLEIDPGRIRRGLLRWREKKLAGEKTGAIRRSPVAIAGRISARRSSPRRRDLAQNRS
jgi:hypothetical protein